MRVDKRLTLLGVLIVVLSTTMATQYATTRATYSFSIVHPSDSDIRYIGSDNSSSDSQRVLRVTNNVTGAQYVTLEFGSWMPNSKKNYTASFGIVNEESVGVNITNINLTGINSSYQNIWLHGDRDIDAGSDATGVKVINDGSALYGDSDVVWTLGAGNGNIADMCADSSTQLPTAWDETSHVRYSINDANNSVNETSDFVWVQITLDIPTDAALQSATGTIYIHFKASAVP